MALVLLNVKKGFETFMVKSRELLTLKHTSLVNSKSYVCSCLYDFRCAHKLYDETLTGCQNKDRERTGSRSRQFQAANVFSTINPLSL